MEFRNTGSGLQIRTGPNNPDGSLVKEKCDIWDAAYAHEVYGWDRTVPDAGISIWSAAKLYGLSGLRIGWLATWDEEVARKAAHYVEITTSGVSLYSQWHLADVIAAELQNNDEVKESYAEARAHLLQNSFIIRGALEPHCDVLDGVLKPMGPRLGMFGWVKAKKPVLFGAALEKSKVKFVTGEACGMYEHGWYRISAGHRLEYTKNAMDKLLGALDSLSEVQEEV